MPCYEYGVQVDSEGRHFPELVICTPGELMTYQEEKEPERWCFACRKRSTGTWRLRGEPPEVMSYYEPNWSYRCDNCGMDGMYGFGRERVWH